MELRVTIGMARSIARLAIRLQAVAETVQQLADQRAAHPVAHVAQGTGEPAQALAGPKQR